MSDGIILPVPNGPEMPFMYHCMLDLGLSSDVVQTKSVFTFSSTVTYVSCPLEKLINETGTKWQKKNMYKKTNNKNYPYFMKIVDKTEVLLSQILGGLNHSSGPKHKI